MRFIGVDPGVNTGVCEIENGAIVCLQTSSFWPVFWSLWHRRADEGIAVFIEDSRCIRAVYKDKLTHNAKKDRKIAQNVGGVKVRAELMIDGLKDAGINITPIAPLTRKPWGDVGQFRRVTGWRGECSDHATDACSFIWGMR